MALAEEIEELVRLKPGLTDVVLGRMLQGHFIIYQQQVNSACRRLVAEGALNGKARAAGSTRSPNHPHNQSPCSSQSAGRHGVRL